MSLEAHETRPPFEGRLQYCVRCCMSETEEGATFDALGICSACRSAEQKMHIDWAARERQLRRILEEARAKAGDNYDCIVPISGGKDSTFQLHVLVKVYGMKPLAVTFSHNWYSETGWHNLVNALETFNVDHIMFTPNRALVNKLARRSLCMIGDPCWHCHAGVGHFPLQVAVRFEIPLLVFGEPPWENHNWGSYQKGAMAMTRERFIEVSAKKRPEEMVGDGLTSKDLYPFRIPTEEEYARAGVKQIYLGEYLFWDDERQTEFVRDTYGWRETEIENTYKGYKSAECIMPGLHDFTLYLKKGYGRATMHASIDTRAGLLSRPEGFALARRHDGERPEALDYFIEQTGMSEEEFYAVMRRHRLPQLAEADIPVRPKGRPNAETIRPYFQRIAERSKMTVHVYGEPSPVPPTTPAPSIFTEWTIARIVEEIGARRIGTVEVARACVERVGAWEDRFGAWEVFDPEALIAQARLTEARRARGEACRPIEGIPVGVKDVYNTRDFPTQMGSPLWKGFTPGNDARAVFHVRRAGGLIAGKTVTAEFAVHALGKTLNPHDPTRNPGTSSSGSAVAIALGMVPVALGTQTAASIVRPASFSGVYGCKPSFGLIPRTGVLKTTDSLDTLGFFVVHAEDLERIFDVLRVHGDDYPIAEAALRDPQRQEKPAGRPWRVAFCRTHLWENAEPYVREAVEGWVGRLAEEGGVEVVEVALPGGMERAHEVHGTIYDRTLSYYFQEEFKRSELISDEMNEIVRRGMKISAERYHECLEEQERMIETMDRFLAGFDAIVTMATATEAPPREVKERPDPGLIWTLAHLPVVCAPAFRSPSGLPFGLQIASRKYNDLLLFRFVRFLLERALIPPGPNPPAAALAREDRSRPVQIQP